MQMKRKEKLLMSISMMINAIIPTIKRRMKEE